MGALPFYYFPQTPTTTKFATPQTATKTHTQTNQYQVLLNQISIRFRACKIRYGRISLLRLVRLVNLATTIQTSQIRLASMLSDSRRAITLINNIHSVVWNV